MPISQLDNVPISLSANLQIRKSAHPQICIYAYPQIRKSANSHKRKSAYPQICKSAININMKKAIIVSGYFNPIHKGHIEYFNNAKALGEYLIVIVNNDKQRALKGSKEFQQEDERVFIVSNIKSVDQVFLSIDEDRTVCATIQHIHELLHHDYQLAFANGGDQNNNSIPEVPVCEKLGITLLDGLGDKIQSSSWLLK